MPPKNNAETIIISREHDKVCILEKLLHNDNKLETIVSNFIDCSIQKDDCGGSQYFSLIKDYVKDFNSLLMIINIATSIAHDTSIELPISIVNDENIITYLEEQYIPFIPNDYFYAFS